MESGATPGAGQAGCLAFDVVYTPRAGLGLGWAAWRELAATLVGSRDLAWRLFRRNIAARYSQSFLGYAWAVTPSLVTVITFTLLRRSRILDIGSTDVPYPVFVMLGLAVWQLFADGLTKSTQSLAGAGSLVSKINFPREALVLAAMGEALFDLLIRAALVAILFVAYGVTPSWTVVLIPAVLAPLVLLIIGIGFVGALINAVFRDVANFLMLALTFGMFLTPVVYPPPSRWPLSLINYLNPVSPFVIAVRDLATNGSLSQPLGLLGGAVAGMVALLIGWRIFHLGAPRIIERV